jgi:hypothetical protein
MNFNGGIQTLPDYYRRLGVKVLQGTELGGGLDKRE